MFSSRTCIVDIQTDSFKPTKPQNLRSVVVDWTQADRTRAQLPVSKQQVLGRSLRKGSEVVPTVSTMSDCCCSNSVWPGLEHSVGFYEENKSKFCQAYRFLLNLLDEEHSEVSEYEC